MTVSPEKQSDSSHASSSAVKRKCICLLRWSVSWEGFSNPTLSWALQSRRCATWVSLSTAADVSLCRCHSLQQRLRTRPLVWASDQVSQECWCLRFAALRTQSTASRLFCRRICIKLSGTSRTPPPLTSLHRFCSRSTQLQVSKLPS